MSSSTANGAASRLSAAVHGLEARITAGRVVRETDRIKVMRDAVEEQAAHRRAQIIDLRNKGWTLQQIADLMHVTPQNVHKIINADKKKESTS